MLGKLIAAGVAVGLIFLAAPAHADFDSGVRAYRAGDYKTAVKEWDIAARSGHVPAQWTLAKLFARGGQVTRSDQKAFGYALLAAQSGMADAQVMVGDYYRSGIPGPNPKKYVIEKDPVIAIEWYERAAYQFHAPSQTRIGTMYLAGEGVPRDPAEAMRWFVIAVRKQYAPAAMEFAKLYDEGKVVEKDPAESFKWLILADRFAVKDYKPMVNSFYEAMKKRNKPEAEAEGKLRAERWLRENS
jgi:TPR repeat protein